MIQKEQCVLIQFLRKTFRPTMALMGLLSLLSLLLAGCGSPPSYNCGTALANHCYGVVSWNHKTAIDGSFVLIYTVRLSGADIFMDNEMWLIQDNPSAWVETGFLYNPGYSQDNAFFWAQHPPNGVLSVHYQESVPPNNRSSNFIIFRLNSSTFLIGIETSDGWLEYDATNNTMVPNRLDIGMELAGTQGGSAPTADFISPGWFGSQDGQNGGHWESSDGAVRSDNPPSGHWANAPSSGGVADFQTSCC